MRNDFYKNALQNVIPIALDVDVDTSVKASLSMTWTLSAINLSQTSTIIYKKINLLGNNK